MAVQPTDQSRRQVLYGGVVGAIAASGALFSNAAEAAGPGALPAGQGSRAALDDLKALFDSYFKAFSAHNSAGLVQVFAPNAIVIGTGPGEIWGGREEIGEAHRRFFEAFDPGKQESEAVFRAGNIIGDMAWLTSMAKVKFTKGSAVAEFGLNSSVVFEKTDGKWLIRSLHFSNLTDTPPASKS